MKIVRSLALTVLMISLLTGCAASREAAEEKREAILARGFSCEARLTCDLGNTVTVYTMEAALGEQTHLRVIEPEALCGLGATVERKTLSLCYQDAVFACELPEDSVYSPVMVLPAAWAALCDGVVVKSEKTEEGLLAVFSRFEGEEEYLFAFLFGGEDTPIKRISLEKNGRELASVVILRTL